jgi:hypothetical protein
VPAGLAALAALAVRVAPAAVPRNR